MEYSARHQRFRDLLRQIRIDAGLTQVQLAEKLGKPQSYVSKAEMGERRLDFIETLDFCEACNVGVEALAKSLSDAG
ncbi:MAG: helix-turn-helix transcriptional regulator [Verrucomicrobiales bacterium]|nr:helix-turn-helix transcriptional regulator [Verrucomicrobiales bacterium]